MTVYTVKGSWNNQAEWQNMKADEMLVTDYLVAELIVNLNVRIKLRNVEDSSTDSSCQCTFMKVQYLLIHLISWGSDSLDLLQRNI